MLDSLLREARESSDAVNIAAPFSPRVRATAPVRVPVAVGILLAVAAAATFAHALFTVFGLGKPELAGVFNEWVYDGVLVVCSTACLLRGLLVRRERAAWLVIAAGLWSWTLGDVYWNAKLAHL